MRMLAGYFALAFALVAFGVAAYYGIAASRFEDKGRFTSHRWLAFFFPARYPEYFEPNGLRLHNRQLLALIVGVLALVVAALLSPR